MLYHSRYKTSLLVPLAVSTALLGATHGAQEVCPTPSVVETLGGGTPGPGGVPVLQSSGDPLVNFPLSLDVANSLPGSFGFVFLSPNHSPIFLPGYGATAHPDILSLTGFSFTLDESGSSESVVASGPLVGNYCGGQVIAQAIVFDPGAAGMVAFTDGLRLVIGGKDVSGPPPGAPIPPQPTLDPHPTLTALAQVTLSGSAPGAATVEVQGPAGLVSGLVTADLFSVTVGLLPNQVNALFVTAISDLGAESPPASTKITRDVAPPKVFIDFPTSGTTFTTASVDVAGRVSDVLSGFNGLQVDVNGIPAAIDVGIGTNGTFFAPAVPLNLVDATPITVTAMDFLGNTAVAQVTVLQEPATGAIMTVESGGAQQGPVGVLLPAPIVVKLLKLDGVTPFANKTVTFKVTKSNGQLAATPGGAASASLQVKTDAQGFARAYWTLGSDAGCGNNRVQATSKDVSGSAFFCASALANQASSIAIGMGNSQSAEQSTVLPAPLRVWVSDGQNGVGGVPVTFTVIKGTGLVGGASSAVVVLSLIHI